MNRFPALMQMQSRSSLPISVDCKRWLCQKTMTPKREPFYRCCDVFPSHLQCPHSPHWCLLRQAVPHQLLDARVLCILIHAHSSPQLSSQTLVRNHGFEYLRLHDLLAVAISQDKVMPWPLESPL